MLKYEIRWFHWSTFLLSWNTRFYLWLPCVFPFTFDRRRNHLSRKLSFLVQVLFSPLRLLGKVALHRLDGWAELLWELISCWKVLRHFGCRLLNYVKFQVRNSSMIWDLFLCILLFHYLNSFWQILNLYLKNIIIKINLQCW